MTMEFRSAETASDAAHALDVLEEGLGREAADYFSMLFDFSGYRTPWIQIARSGGEVVGALSLAPRLMRMGRSTWRVAVLLPLAVKGGQPDAAADGLVEQALAAARREGCVAATVLGDPTVFARSGFAPVRPSYASLIPVANVVESESPVRVRGMRPEDMERVQLFQERCARRRPWSVVRDADWWRWQRELWDAGEEWASWRFFSSPEDFVVAEREGEMAGYARLQLGEEPEVLLCTEVEIADDDYEAAAALLWRMRARAVAAERRVIHVPAPRWMPFVAQTYEIAGQHVTRPAAASMMRVLDLPAALADLAEELSHRLAATRYCAYSGRLVVGFGPDQVVLDIREGRVSVSPEEPDEDEGVEVAEKAAVQMLAGYRRPEDLRAAGQIEGAPEDVELLAALFPAREPFTWGADLLY